MAAFEEKNDLTVDQRLNRLEKQLRLSLVAGSALLAVLVLTAWGGQSGSEKVFEKIRVRQITVVDDNGVERIYIGSPVPDPKIDGRRVERVSPATGIIMNDENGNERNGWGLFPDGRQTFCLDYEKGLGEALCLTQGGKRSGLIIKDMDQRFNLILGRLAVSGDEDEAKMLMMDSSGRSSIRLAVADEKGNPGIRVIGDDGQSIFETTVSREK